MLGGRIRGRVKQFILPLRAATRPVRFVARDRGRQEASQEIGFRNGRKHPRSSELRHPSRGGGQYEDLASTSTASSSTLLNALSHRVRDNGCSGRSKRKGARRVPLLETIPAHALFRVVVRKGGSVLTDESASIRIVRRTREKHHAWLVGRLGSPSRSRELRFSSKAQAARRVSFPRGSSAHEVCPRVEQCGCRSR